MRKLFLVLTLVSVSCLLLISFSPKNVAEKEQYVLFYYGATDCYYCNVPENILNINKLCKGIGKKYPGTKKVMVCMDKDLQEGLRFINKYDSVWNEISIGSFYQNELAYAHLNKTKVPGVPHIVLIKRVYTDDNQYKIPVSIRTEIIVDLVGGKEINEWIREGLGILE
jgi:hypothetical protein